MGPQVDISCKVGTMTPSSIREVVNVFWPMTIPAHARFSITSPFPLEAIYPHNVSFTLTLEAPIHLSSPSPIHVIPSGILSSRFARGWSALPTELKLAILRHNLIYSSVIWPRNANQVMHKSLFPYLRMTPEIASLSRALFFAENTFIVSALQEELSMFRDFPPVSVRPLIRKVTLLTWLELGDRETIEAIADKRLGFQGLAHVNIRCSVTKFVRSLLSAPGTAAHGNAEGWIAQLTPRLPPQVSFEPKGAIEFDRPEFGRGDVDREVLELVELVEGLIKRRFRFGVPPRA